MINGCNYVYDLESALTAIETIVSEGEGTSITDIWKNGVNHSDLSHFHKFLEIFVGYPIIKVERHGIDHKRHAVFKYIFAKSEDEKINYNKDGVQLDERAWKWLKYSTEKGGNDTSKHKKHANDIRVITFNQTYGKLLLALQYIIDGKKRHGNRRDTMSYIEIEKIRQREVANAIGLMRQLQINYGECLRPSVMPGFGIHQPKNDQAPVHKYTPIAPNWVPPENMLRD